MSRTGRDAEGAAACPLDEVLRNKTRLNQCIGFRGWGEVEDLQRERSLFILHSGKVASSGSHALIRRGGKLYDCAASRNSAIERGVGLESVALNELCPDLRTTEHVLHLLQSHFLECVGPSDDSVVVASIFELALPAAFAIKHQMETGASLQPNEMMSRSTRS